MHQHRISIWFFIGILLGIYGILILGAGINEMLHPPEYSVKTGLSARRNLVGSLADSPGTDLPD